MLLLGNNPRNGLFPSPNLHIFYTHKTPIINASYFQFGNNCSEKSNSSTTKLFIKPRVSHSSVSNINRKRPIDSICALAYSCSRLIHHVWKEHSKPRQRNLGRLQPFWLLNCALSRINIALRWLSAQYADFKR